MILTGALLASLLLPLLLLQLLPTGHAFDRYPKQLIFELPDSAEFCFYQDFADAAAVDGGRYTVSFRVVRGGNNDVDFAVKSPRGERLYDLRKAHVDERQFKFPSRDGAYSFCFGNQFSTVTHKLVYFSLNRNQPESLAEEAGGPLANASTAMTLMQAKMEAVHEHLARAETSQSAYKAREVDGRAVSEDLNRRVMTLSAVLSAAVLLCGFGQVAALKTLFADKKLGAKSAGGGGQSLLPRPL